MSKRSTNLPSPEHRADSSTAESRKLPLLISIGDSGLLVKFGTSLSEVANHRAIRCAEALRNANLHGVVEVVPSLVSVLLCYDPWRTSLSVLQGEVRLLISVMPDEHQPVRRRHTVAVAFGGDGGPDLQQVASALGLRVQDFVNRHNSGLLRILATGFAPGFMYCGFHSQELHLPRRTSLRASVPAGSVLFASGQTAIAATEIPTGWHVIGTTSLRNFDASASPPTVLRAGDEVTFEEVH